MTEQELKLFNNISQKAKELDENLNAIKFRTMRTKKSIKACKEVCEKTNEIIGDLDAKSNR